DPVNWSCAYDAFLNLMWNLWVQSGPHCFERIIDSSVEMNHLVSLFSQVDQGTWSLEAVRCAIRERLALRGGTMFPLYGHVSIAVDNVFGAFLSGTSPSVSLTRVPACCSNCGCMGPTTEAIPSPIIWESQAVEDSANRHPAPLPMSIVVSDLLRNVFSVRCTVCRHHIASEMIFSDVPNLLVVNLNRRTTAHVPLYIEPTLLIPTTMPTQSLLRIYGIVYWGDNHFTTQLVDRNGNVWYNDGA
ncbi:hypothetical protein BDW22DRAFT_1299397, partial [Trametopsis cervina]